MFRHKKSFRRASTSNNGTAKRELYIHNNEYNRQFHFPSNEIKTSKYSFQNFLPKALILQFKRIANFYFLIIAILQSISIISPLSPFSAIAPFVIVIGLSMFREALEDKERHKSDLQTNNQTCLCYKDKQFRKILWKDVKVGDILKIEEMDLLPADLLIIGSSIPDGSCYLETSSLDGEKNLKPKNAIKNIMNLGGEEVPFRFEGKILCMNPNSNLYQFDGSLDYQGEKIFLDGKNLLIRGARLKSTKFAFGVVVYTGIDTKIMKNSEASKFKQTAIEKRTNRFIIFIFILQLLLCVTTGVLNFVWNYRNKEDHWYLYFDYSNEIMSLISFFTYFLLNNTMIPISLIVSLEFIKVAQAFFIKNDEDFICADNENSISVFSSSLNESLGQIEYIFSDKTGTLTCNKMEFKFAMIGNTLYGDASFLDKEILRTMKRKITYCDKKGGIEYTFDDPKIKANLKKNAELGIAIADADGKKYIIKTEAQLIEEYMLLLATCHECIMDFSSDPKMPRYQGPSPDEIALVDAARHIGAMFEGRNGNFVKLNFWGSEKEIEVLATFQFNSNRKRMSVIIKHDGVIKLYCKGADNIILARLSNDDQPFKEDVMNNLNEFSKKGLRTLCIAMKVIGQEEYKRIAKEMKIAEESPDRDNELDLISEEVEKDLLLIGATALEDRLQDKVPETIEYLLKANIKICMLTGDKLETAENIAKSCNLITNDMNVYVVKLTTILPQERIDEINQKIDVISIEVAQNILQKKPKAFLIEGETLCYIIKDKDLRKKYVNLIKDFESVICCRVTPKQKADVVSLIKTYLRKMTLSIGDGSNDVNMIQEADIGIGIYGQEGLRAVQASDYAVAEFKSLWKLVIVHGRWSYLRISETILYFFYKNMVFTIPQFFFAFISAFSGQSIFDDWYISLYNLVFTCFPLLIRGIFDQDIYYKYRVPLKDKGFRIKESSKVKEQYSNLYFMSQKNLLFTKVRFSLFLIEGLLNGLFIFLTHYFAFNWVILNKSGYSCDFWIFSISMFTSTVFIANMKLSIITQNWTILNWVALLGTSFATYFIYIWISDNLPIDIADTAVMLFSSPSFYLCLFACVLPFFGFQIFYYSVISPRPALISTLRNVLENEKKGKNVEDVGKSMEMSKKLSNDNTDFSFDLNNRLNKRLL